MLNQSRLSLVDVETVSDFLSVDGVLTDSADWQTRVCGESKLLEF